MNDAARLEGRRIAVYGSAGAPWHHLALAAVHGAEVGVVRAEDIKAGRLDAWDALVMPGGGATAMHGMLEPLGLDGASTLRSWVRRGGTYVSSCAGSVLPIALDDEAAISLPVAQSMRMVDVRLANPGDATLGGLASPGVGVIEIRVDPRHRFSAALPERMPIMHYNGPFFDLSTPIPGVQPFAWPTAASRAFTYAEHFLAGGVDTNKVFDACVSAGAAMAIEADVDQGRAILFGSHPEFGLGPLGIGWADASHLLLEALASVAPTEARPSPAPAPARRSGADAHATNLAEAVATDLDRLADRTARLAGTNVGAWLEPTHAASFHGREARAIWREDLMAASSALTTAARGLRTCAPYVDPARRIWLDDAPTPGQDYGAMGIVQLTRRIEAMLERADDALNAPLESPSHAYDLFDHHPYHLAAASYLSAAGLCAAVLLQVATLGARAGAQDEGVLQALLQPAALTGMRS